MKKIYYLLTLAAIAVYFSACRPLDKSYDQLGDVPKPTAPVIPDPTIASITLTPDDYFFVPPINPAQSLFYFKNDIDAVSNIPAILAEKYPSAVNKSQITVKYSLTPVIPSFKPADSVFTHVAYTLADPADYLTVTTRNNFSAAQVITFLGKKYTTPVDNQLALLTFNLFENNVTTSVTQSFIYTGGAWKKIYTVSAAQYATLGKGGTNNDFAAADDPSIPGYLSALLVADPTISSTAKAGDVQFVSYKYYGGSAANTFQRVMPVTFDGTKWVGVSASNSAIFSKNNGQWTIVYDNTISYTLASPTDYATIAAIPNVATNSGAAANLKSFSNFSLVGGTASVTRWTDADIAKGVDAILQAKYGTVASPDQKFLVTLTVYGPYKTETLTFKYDATAKDFVYVPVPDNAKYTLTGDDYVTVLGIPNVGSSAAVANLTQYGNFSTSGATVWTDDQINAAVAAVLKLRYPNATANQQVATTFGIYKSGNTTATRNFKFDGANFVLVP